MIRLKPERLRRVHTIDDVVAYLADELDWPVGADVLDEVTFDYEPEELGIPAERVPRLTSLRELQPLTTDQPWGIFFLEFAGPRLPLTSLRHLLRSLVAKKRATTSSHRTWRLDDLLFVTATDSGESIELHFVAFFESGEEIPEIRSLPWRPEQSPIQHLRRLTTELLPSLVWPDDPSAIDKWRLQWRGAFKLRHGEAIRTAADLAARMAHTADFLRKQIAAALASEGGRGPFTDLLLQVRAELVADVDDARFADMCAQTLVYGLLSSRVTDPQAFGASPVLTAVPLSNMFLAAFFDQVQDQTVALGLDNTALEQLIADLRVSNTEAILDQFGSTAKGGDPVIHFYEEFLKRYDSKLRADAGAFYTPQSVVRFMVRSVDAVLRSRFGLSAGIADTSTWREVAEHNDFECPLGVDPEAPFVSMIDPATGTGTYLVEWMRHARDAFHRVNLDRDWSEHLKEQIIPSMHAFELMLGPYAIAHLKVALEVRDQDGDDAEASILLTDTLDHPSAAAQLPTLSDPVAAEGARAAGLKQQARFTVCIGNPPYDREQRDPSARPRGKRKGGVVRYGVAGVPVLLDDVIEPLRQAGLGQHAKNVYNDYVYFWRWGTWQAVQRLPGPGIVALITASSYLDGVSLGGLRSHLRGVFDELWIVDLGGEGRGARPEENVFDIRTPVAIALGVRTGGPKKTCTVRYLRIKGTRAEKLSALDQLSMETAPWQEVEGEGLATFVPRTGSDYYSWSQVTDLFPWIHSGSQFKRTWPIGPSKSVLERRWDALCEARGANRARAMRETSFRSLQAKVTSLAKTSAPLKPIGKIALGDEHEGVKRYGYRSFDRQWAIADNRLADRPRPPLWSVRSEHQVFFTTLTSTKLGRGPVLAATPYVPDLDHFSGRGAKNVMPFWRNSQASEANITRGLLDALSQELGTTVEPEDLAAYVYGLLGTSAFADRFSAELDEGAGPVRVPLTSDADFFDQTAALGRDLLWWHTWGKRFSPDGIAELPTGSGVQVEPVRGYPASFKYDAGDQRLTVGTGIFSPVAPEVWQFEVSGLRVLQSWLAYRMVEGKGRKSSPLDDIRPERWTFTDELLRLLSILEHTIDVTPAAAKLLDEIVSGPLVDPADLPSPTDGERKPPH